jgi:hypothetical protein
VAKMVKLNGFLDSRVQNKGKSKVLLVKIKLDIALV